MTDQYSGYNILDKENEKNFIRVKVDHSVTYSLGNGVHTNGIESFWAIVKEEYTEYIIMYQSTICRDIWMSSVSV